MPLTDAENAALAITAELYKALLDLPVEHPHDIAEHVRDIHDIQNRILSRPGYREHHNAE